MSKRHTAKSDFEKKLEKEAKTYEPAFWLIPEWLRIFTPMDVATNIELLELELEVKRIERMAKGEGGALQDALYRMGRYAWFYTWTALTIIFSVVLMVAAYVLWFAFLGYAIYWLFTP